MKSTSKGITIILLLAVAMLCLVCLSCILFSIFSILKTPLAPTPIPTQTAIPPIVILNHLRAASELTTAIVNGSAIISINQDNAKILGLIDAPKTKVDFFAAGDVRAGFNLSDLTVSDIDVNGTTVTIRLPSPKILAYGITESRVLKIDVPEFLGFDLGKLENETLDQAQQKALQEIIYAACEKNILDDANRYSEQSISNLIALFGFQKVNIITQPAHSCP